MKKSLILLSCLFLSGCLHWDDEPVQVSNPQIIRIEKAEQAREMVLTDVKWAVWTTPELLSYLLSKNIITLTPEQLDEANSKAKLDKGVWVVLNIEDYENLAINFSEIKRYIENQQSIIKYYEDATEPSRKKE